MSMYVLHGFRWPRKAIREWVIVNNVDDAAPDYLMSATTPDALKASMTKKFPDIMARVPNLQFIEQHDPEAPAIQTFAFVADVVVQSNQHIDIDMARKCGPKPAAWDAFMDLKAGLYEFAKNFQPNLPEFTIGWYAVYNGDPERCQDNFEGPVDAPDNSEEEDPDVQMSGGSGQQSPEKKKSSNLFKKFFK